MRDWRSFGRHENPWIENDAEGLQIGAAFFKQRFQFRSVVAAVVFSIQFQPDPAIRRQMGSDIAQEVIPFGGTPKFVALVIIEADQIGGDEIKFAIELWQWLKRLDPRDGAGDAQKLGQLAKHRKIIDIEPEDFVPEQFVDVEKISGAAAEIENAGGRSIVETQLSYALQIDSNPILEIEVFRWRIAGIVDCILAPNLFEPVRVDRFDNSVCADASGETAIAHDRTGVAPCAFEGFAGEDFSEFLGETQGPLVTR